MEAEHSTCSQTLRDLAPARSTYFGCQIIRTRKERRIRWKGGKRCSLHDYIHPLPIFKGVNILYHVLVSFKQTQNLHLTFCVRYINGCDELQKGGMDISVRYTLEE